MQELLKIIAQGLVEKPDEVSVTMDEPKEDGSVVWLDELDPVFEKTGKKELSVMKQCMEIH